MTSVGGDAVTLAASGAGVVTSKFGSVYHVATSAAGEQITGNSAASPLHVNTALLIGAASVVGSVMLGALITL